jgi:hypothetical protein
LLSVTATKIARVFSFMPLKEAPQLLDTNLNQRLIRVGLLGLMLGCQHTSMWRDMAQHILGLVLLHVQLYLHTHSTRLPSIVRYTWQLEIDALAMTD